MIVYIILSIIILFLLYISNNKIEHYNMGTIDQLLAKDTQDIYLTGYHPNYYMVHPLNTNYTPYIVYGSPYMITTSKKKTLHSPFPYYI